MKKVIILILFFSSFLFAEYYKITTIDGKTYYGNISNPNNILEWRKDIYINTKNNEKFILKPEYTGKIKIDLIKEIKKINPDFAPAKHITLTNGTKAKLLLNYIIKLKNGNNFYISDFITLNNYYINIENRQFSKKIYITTIKNLELEKSRKTYTPIVKKKTIKTSPKKFATTIIPIKTKTKNTNIEKKANNKKTVNSLLVISIILTILVIILLLTIVALYLQYKKTISSKKRKKKKTKTRKKNKIKGK